MASQNEILNNPTDPTAENLLTDNINENLDKSSPTDPAIINKISFDNNNENLDKSSPTDPAIINNISFECEPLVKQISESTLGLLKLPGFIDVHVQCNTKCTTFRQNFANITAAALAGGITLVCVLPNICPPIIDENALNLYLCEGNETAYCDYSIYLAATSFCIYNCELATKMAGLLLYLSNTTRCTAVCTKLDPECRSLQLPSMNSWLKFLFHWPKNSPAPIVCFGARYAMAAVILYAHISNRPIHLCNVTTREEIIIIRTAKIYGINVTCEICAHNLFLSTDDIDKIAEINDGIKPILSSPDDQKALWDNLNYIDIFSTYHSGPYNKNSCQDIQPGLPGLEIIVPLFLNAIKEGRLTMDDLVSKFYKNPMRIFHFPEQPNTYILVNLEKEWTIPEKSEYSSLIPYSGMTIKGTIERVVLRGKIAFNQGEIRVPSGFGINIRHKCYSNWKRCMP